MSAKSTKLFHAMIPGGPEKKFEYLGEAIDWLRSKKLNGAIYELDQHGDWQARYVIKQSEIISLRGLTGKMLHEAIFND